MGVDGRPATIDDDQLLAGFEDLSLEAARFDHVAHVRVAWLYLRRSPDGGDRFAADLRRYAAHHGAPDKYSREITERYLALIRDRIARAPDADWAAFAAANPDLLVWHGS